VFLYLNIWDLFSAEGSKRSIERLPKEDHPHHLDYKAIGTHDRIIVEIIRQKKVRVSPKI